MKGENEGDRRGGVEKTMVTWKDVGRLIGKGENGEKTKKGTGTKRKEGRKKKRESRVGEGKGFGG